MYNIDKDVKNFENYTFKKHFICIGERIQQQLWALAALPEEAGLSRSIHKMVYTHL